MYLDGNRKRLLWRVGLIYTLICLASFFSPGILMPDVPHAFGMEAETVWETEETESEKTEPEAVSTGTVESDEGRDTPCTIFIYMCGSNLESKYGLASDNIDELLEADIPDSTTVVIETGGTSRWWSSEWIADDSLQRYIVKDHHLELVMEMDNASMGDAYTFSDFLRWGGENYFSDRNILVMWDHGGSSGDGVCYDENYRFDCLDRSELVSAFDQAHLPGRFDLICLDTCYMGELLNASLLSDYARYMTASQTIVPGPGMDYTVLAEGAGKSDLEEFGKILCDIFLVKCAQTGRAEEAQLSFYDLDAVGPLIEEVDKSANTLRKLYEKTGASFEIFLGAQKASISGSGSSSNMIDLMHFVNSMSYLDWSFHRKRIQSLLDEMVLYQALGVYSDLNGVSIFYPITYREAQLEAYEEISSATNYCTLLHEIYTDIPDETILFKDPGSIGEDGSFEMELEKESLPYIRNIILRVWREDARYPDYFTLLADSEVDTFVTGLDRKLSGSRVSSQLSGEACALEGHLLLLSVDSRRLTQVYSAPVQVNGEDTRYTFVAAKSLLGHLRTILYTMLGSFVDENGLPSREMGHLKKGDKVSVYAALDEAGEKLEAQEEFTISEDIILPEYIPLPEGTYRCQYIVTDIIGRTTGSDYCLFEITEEDGTRNVRPTEIRS